MGDAGSAQPADTREICAALWETKVFSHYAYGDPLPTNAEYIAEGNKTASYDDAISVYVRCEREAGHPGKHLARHTSGWEQA